MTGDEQILEPDPPEVDAESQFLRALGEGNASAAAKALRTLISLEGELRGMALEILAERFEGHPDWFYPWRLQFKLPRRGAPPKAVLPAAARESAIKMKVKEALAKPNMNLKAAVAEVSKQTGFSEAKVYKSYYAGEKRRRHSDT